MQMIIDTEKHEVSKDADTNFLLDIDLTILGSQPLVYQQYCQQIREEYRIYDDEAYRTGRKQVLVHLISQNNIYKTEYFQNKYEDQAIFNLNIELASL